MELEAQVSQSEQIAVDCWRAMSVATSNSHKLTQSDKQWIVEEAKKLLKILEG
jgi:hypothetical protein